MGRIIFSVILFILLFGLEGNSQQLICENRNPDGHRGVKSRGDGKYGITVLGPGANTGQYFPNQVYTVTIHGERTRFTTSKFTEFILVVESEKQAMLGQSGLVTTGIFHIVDNTLSTFSYTCPDAIINSNLKPKNEITVRWTAPSMLVASCITFKATVVERPHLWFMDEGNLTKILCPYAEPTRATTTRATTTTTTTTMKTTPPPLVYAPTAVEDSNSGSKISENRNSNDQCCPCDDAKYEVDFEGIWSKETHPKDFPENLWLLHFSDIIGASHSKDFYFWNVGQTPTEGIRHVAEWGATRQLENELKAKSKYVNTIIKARGLWHPNEKGRTSASFRVDKHRHLMSLVTMIGPSPDWFVGVSGFNLCTPNCTWIEEEDFDLYPYDAGTDSGVSYMSPNTPTEPRGIITELTSTYPNDTRSPFYDPNGPPMKPFARARLRKQRIYRKSCSDSVHTSEDSHEIIVSENTEEATRPECAVGDWTPWSDCSVTCGKGLRMRKRSYRMEAKATMMGCDRQLIEKEMCLAAVHTCDNEDNDGIEEIVNICDVTNWSDWTPCSATCGKGVQHRSRRYKNHMGRKKCSKEMSETQMCTAMKECGPEILESPSDPDCPVTPWSEWSPCSTTCGLGHRERNRFFLLRDKTMPMKCSRIEMTQRSPCNGEYGDCNIGMAEAKEICMLPAETGLCRANQQRFFFSQEKGMCVPFTYGGCKGNRNRFETAEECTKTCGFLSGQQIDLQISGQLNPQVESRVEPNTGSRVEAHAGSRVESQPGSRVEPQTGSRIEPNTGSRVEPQTGSRIEPNTGSRVEPLAGSRVEPQTGSRLEPQTGSRIGSRIDPQTGSRVQPQIQPPTQVKVEPEIKQLLELQIERVYKPRTSQQLEEEPEVGNLLLNTNINRQFEKITDDELSSTIEPQPLALEKPRISGENTLGPVDCAVSDWTEWSECSVTCGVGHMSRERVITTEPQNDGQRCPRRLKKRRICTMRPC